MKALVIGSGGREYTIGWKLSKSNIINKVFFAPGNGGTNAIGENIGISLDDFEAIYNEIIKNNIELVIIGPEDPLVNGLVDFLKAKKNKNLKIVGPSQKGAMLEGSKTFAKEFMIKNSIPTARYKSFSSSELTEAVNFLQELKPPYVIKADGLAAGKGVLILNEIDAAKHELQLMFSGKFGTAGKNVVIEEFLDGIELSVFVITDGCNYKILPNSKDYKRIGDNDTGLNTGGMGAVSPVPFADEVFMAKVENKIIKPTIAGLKNDKIDYKGFIFLGLIKVDNEPYVIEYNVRLGDPETQVVLPRIESDFAEMMLSIADENIENYQLKISDQTALTIVLASGGYPEKYEKNIEINIQEPTNNTLFIHAGTKFENGKLLTNGGRVITVTALDKNIVSARKIAYSDVNKVTFYKKYFRNDIGLDLV
ncbi:MAG: phosphoribosylamine--glycine ligase [Bacteroidales bacterium]|nr:phosphoribosylamine--glycine ligase [Bacteroidales bacterium]